MGGAYIGADLGPRQGCITGSVPFSFGGDDGLINNSATPSPAAAIDLTPNASYSCKSTAGEISWNNVTHKLRCRD